MLLIGGIGVSILIVLLLLLSVVWSLMVISLRITVPEILCHRSTEGYEANYIIMMKLTDFVAS